MRTKHQFKIRDASPDRQPKVQSSLVREILQRIMGQTNKDCRFQIFHFDKFPTPATFDLRKIRFKTEVRTCSQFTTEAMHWIKEVEMVDSVDDLMSSSSVRGIRMPDFEVLDARIASALNRIIHNTRFKRKFCLEEHKAQEEDRFLRGRQIACLIYEYSRVTGANDSVENYADLLPVVLRNDDFHEFDAKLDETLWTMTQIPPDNILESLYKLRIRESDKLKTVWELYDLEIHQKKAGPEYHRLRTMVKRSIEQDLRKKNFGARNGNYERNAVFKNQGTKNSVNKEFLEIVGSGKGDNCSFRHDIHKRAKLTQPNPSPNSFMQQDERKASRSLSGRMSRWPCKDYLRGTCNNSFCEKWHPPECLFCKTKSGCRFGEKCSYAHRQVDEQPSKRSRKNDDKSAVAMLKKHELRDRTGQPVVDRDTRRESKSRTCWVQFI